MNSRPRRAAHGFTTVELAAVIGISLIIMAMAVISLQAPLTAMRADAGMTTVLAQLRSARSLALSTRHDVQIAFTAPDQIQITQLARPGEPAANLTVFPPASLGAAGGGLQFIYFPATGDTPDAFGTNPSGIAFGGAATQTFLSDGSFVDPAGQPLNGTLFVGIQGQLNTARAVTILGATGRLRQWKWVGGWIE